MADFEKVCTGHARWSAQWPAVVKMMMVMKLADDAYLACKEYKHSPW